MSKSVSFLFAALFAVMLAALGAGPAFAQGNTIGQSLLDLADALATLQKAVKKQQNLLETKTIFVTSMTYTGDLGGLEGADQKCQDLADGPGAVVPEDDYVALLSTSTVDAIARMTPSIGPVIRSDGAFVAVNFAALFNTGEFVQAERHLLNSIDRDESGEEIVIGFLEAWTGSLITGLRSLNTCIDWTSADAGDLGEKGFLGVVFSDWLLFGSDNCDQPFHLYCVRR